LDQPRCALEFSACRKNFSLTLVKTLSLDTGSTPLLSSLGARRIGRDGFGPRVYAEVIAVMGDAGFELSGAPTRKLTPELAAGPSMLITMGCGDQCPVVPGVKRDDWPLEDPKGKPFEALRAIRDEIRTRVQKLVDRHGWPNR
jgi:hypothetical protein